jgi:hypothetical protein
MDSLKRQKPHKPRDVGLASAAEIAKFILRYTDSPHIVIGPATWQPSDGTAGKRWYCTIAASEAGRGRRCDQVCLAGIDPQAERTEIMAAFIPLGALVLHDTDDELYMARLCEALWPGPTITRLRQTVEAERKAAD